MIYKGWKAFDVDRENLVKYCKISVIKFLKTGEISIGICRGGENETNKEYFIMVNNCIKYCWSCMPDSSLMLELCNILGITVNELLSGERIEMKDYMEKSEANIISVMSEEKKRRKRLYVIIDGLLFVFCIVVFLYTRFF